VAITYDSTSGNIASLQTDGEAIAYTWDGSLLLSSMWSGAIAGNVSWTYDNTLRPVSETVGSNSVSRSYDSYGRLSKVGPESIYYSTDGQSIDSTNCSQVYETFSYSSDFGELSRQRVTGNGNPYILYQADFTRDAVGRIVTKDETVRGTKTTESYTYDALGRLTSVTHNSATTQYSYDTNGNRTDSGAQVDAQDRLLQLNGIPYTYDDDGQLATRTADAKPRRTRMTRWDSCGALRSRRIELITSLTRRAGALVNRWTDCSPKDLSMMRKVEYSPNLMEAAT
jgi:YD repeat-containing protein